MKTDGRSKRLIDLTGKKIGLLTVLRRDEENIGGKPAWVCQCECGNVVTLRSAVLRRGQTSCGCMKGVREKQYVPDYLRRSHSNKLYNQWSGMIYRCTHVNASHFEHYGGRGIDVCPEWKDSFEAFAEWSIRNGYSQGMEIDRINNNLGYSPDNCRWIDHKTNSRNRGARRNSRSGHAGVVWRPSKTGGGGTWRAGIMVNGKQINIGTYQSLDEAIAARKAAEMKYWGFNPENH